MREAVRVPAALLLLCVLTACQGGGLPGQPVPYSTAPHDSPGPAPGTLVVSLAAEAGTNFTSYGLCFQTLAHDAGECVDWQQNSSDVVSALFRHGPDFSTAFKQGVVRAVRLPPGDYEFYTYQAWNAGDGRYYTGTAFFPAQPFSIQFTIRPGRVTYMGEFMAIGASGKNLFGMTIPVGLYYIVKNEAARDIAAAPAVLAKAHSDFNPLGPVDIAVPDPARIGSPVIRSDFMP